MPLGGASGVGSAHDARPQDDTARQALQFGIGLGKGARPGRDLRHGLAILAPLALQCRGAPLAIGRQVPEQQLPAFLQRRASPRYVRVDKLGKRRTERARGQRPAGARAGTIGRSERQRTALAAGGIPDQLISRKRGRSTTSALRRARNF